MPISPATIAAYAPYGNAQLSFEVGSAHVEVDPETGNAVPIQERVDYLATLKLQAPAWDPQAGVDRTTYACQGRLLTPTSLDPRIQNGSQAEAVINGHRGRFELVFDLAMDQGARPHLRQSLQGTFRVSGGGLA